MRKRDAERAAREFIGREHPAYRDCRVDVALEHDGAPTHSWSFAIHVDEEESDYELHRGHPPVGYVHANGYVEGLYGANR